MDPAVIAVVAVAIISMFAIIVCGFHTSRIRTRKSSTDVEEPDGEAEADEQVSIPRRNKRKRERRFRPETVPNDCVTCDKSDKRFDGECVGGSVGGGGGGAGGVGGAESDSSGSAPSPNKTRTKKRKRRPDNFDDVIVKMSMTEDDDNLGLADEEDS